MSSGGDKTKKKGWRAFVAGAAGGACEILATMPLDVIKTQMQVNQGKYRNPIHAGMEIVRCDGPAALYYGMPAFLTQTAGKAAIRFTAYDYMKKSIVVSVEKMGVDSERHNTMINLIAGLGAGTIEALAWTTPTERLKVLRQTEVGEGAASKYSTIMGSIKVISKEQGLRGFYVGAVPTALRQASSVGIRFMFYDTVKGMLASNDVLKSNNSMLSLLSGGTVGAISVTLNNPIDVVKSTIQSKNSPYSGTVECMKGIYANSGAGGFFKGLSARVPRVFCGQAITFAVYEKAIELIDSTFPPKK